MKLRFRFFAALFTLISLLAFSVQDVWAATCAMEMEPGWTAASAGQMDEAQACSAEAAGLMATGAHAPDGSRSGGPHCPSMPMGAAGACGPALALPADISSLLAPSLPEAQLPPRPDSMHELLLAAAFFRPPIA